MKEKTIEDLVECLSLSDDGDDPEKRRAATFWMPEEYKERYDILQEATKRKKVKFSGTCIEVLKAVIDAAWDKHQASAS